MRASDALDDCVITLSIADVSKTFKQVKFHKDAGPEGLTGWSSLTESVIPICFKTTTIGPVHKTLKLTTSICNWILDILMG
jgi:hypothetical protein